MKIVLCGYFNIGSAGDEAALQFILSQFHHDDITVMTRNPTAAYAEQYGVKVHEKLEHRTKSEGAGRNLNGFNPGDDKERLGGIIDLLERADLLLLGPGSWINEHNTDMFRGNLQEMYAMSQLARMVRCPYGIWSSSASRLTRKHLIGQAQALIDGARFVIFRDRLSARTLIDSGVVILPLSKIHELPDAVLGFHKSILGISHNIPHRLVVSAKALHPSIALSYRAGLRQIIKDWISTSPSHHVDLVAQYTGHSPNDIEESLVIAEHLPRVRVLSATTPEQTLFMYSGAGRVIATRLHAMVFATMAGVRWIAAIEYDPKQRGFLEWFGGRGDVNDPETLATDLLKWSCLDVAPLLPELARYHGIIMGAM